MSEQVHVIAVLKAKAGKADDLIAVLEELAKESRQESGCVEYGFYRDQNDSAVLVSFETWKDAEAEAAHWKSPHLGTALQHLPEVLEGEPVIYKGAKVI